MAKHKFTFRAYAVDETEHWNLPAILAGVPVFGLYLIMPGEATHICSFQASTRADFLENVFLLPPEAYEDDDTRGSGQSAQCDAAADLAHNDGGESGSYFDFVDCAAKGQQPYLSEPVTFTLDSRHYTLDAEEYAAQVARAKRFESDQKAHATARYNCLREHAWEVAREWFSGNAMHPPVLMSDDAYGAHRERKVMCEAATHERYHGAPPLFAFGGIAAPLALRANA